MQHCEICLRVLSYIEPANWTLAAGTYRLMRQNIESCLCLARLVGEAHSMVYSHCNNEHLRNDSILGLYSAEIPSHGFSNYMSSG